MPASRRRQFYQQRGIENPALQGERTEEVQNTTRYNPENGSLLTEPRPFNLMFKTYVGPVESEDNMAYLRPETAQAIFAQFKNVLEVSRQKVPFGICQIGKAFRNEINPRNFTFRSREFEQMELEFFIKPGRGRAEAWPAPSPRCPTLDPQPCDPQPNWGWELWHKYWVEQRIALVREHRPGPRHAGRILAEEGGAGPLRQGDGGYPLQVPFGTQELEGIAARGDFDLTPAPEVQRQVHGVFRRGSQGQVCAACHRAERRAWTGWRWP